MIALLMKLFQKDGMAAVYFFIIEQILTIRNRAKHEQAQRFMEKKRHKIGMAT